VKRWPADLTQLFVDYQMPSAASRLLGRGFMVEVPFHSRRSFAAGQEVPIHEDQTVRILVSRELPVVHRDGETGWPCVQ
jgi:hypothetical protein